MKHMDINRSFLKLLCFTTVLYFYANISYSQPKLPPRTMTVTAAQAIHFGTLCLTGGSGGTVKVGFDGSRNSTGGIALLSMPPTAQPAIFDIKLCSGRISNITYSATTVLTGNNGGTLTLDIGPTEKGISGSSFITNNDCNFITQLRVCGTLHIPDNAIPGTYSGNFDITFNQE